MDYALIMPSALSGSIGGEPASPQCSATVIRVTSTFLSPYSLMASPRWGKVRYTSTLRLSNQPM